MSEHDWFRDNLDLFVAGGLTSDESLRADRHAAECAACAQELAQRRLLDRELGRLCSPIHFAGDWDQRVQARWHKTHRPPRRLPAPLRWAGAAAAVVLIGALGAAVNAVAQLGMIAFPGGDVVHANGIQSGVDQVGDSEKVAILVAKKQIDNGATIKVPQDWFEEKLFVKGEEPRDALAKIDDLNGRILKRTLRVGDFIRAEDMLDSKDPQSFAANLPEGYRAIGQRVNLESIAGGFASLPHSRVDIIQTVRRGDDKSSYAQVILENALVLAANAKTTRDEGGNAMPAANVTFALSPEDAMTLTLAREAGPLSLALRKAGDVRRAPVNKVTVDDIKNGPTLPSATVGGGDVLRDHATKRIESLEQLRLGDTTYGVALGIPLNDGSVHNGRTWGRTEPGSPAKYDVTIKDLTARKEIAKETTPLSLEFNAPKLPPAAGGVSAAGGRVAVNELIKKGHARYKEGKFDEAIAEARRAKELDGENVAAEALITLSKHRIGEEAARTGRNDSEDSFLHMLDSGVRISDQAEQARLAKMKELRAGAEYFKVATAGGDERSGKAIQQLTDLQQKQLGALKKEEPRELERAGVSYRNPKGAQVTDGPSAVAAGQPKADAQVAQRKIIRTGDLEFEVSVFDDTVAQITQLIGAIPGAFVATVNSEKLPNGKVKGSVVVRVPPEVLDKFVLDLRQALAKVGELKSQKIGSADVTKQYTDIESRLRAARTMEERFIAIIKNGKGEVKDLIAAERELGVWRTKIEEMEGEIRYYNSQVALSTLTITAYEKEIRAAAAMVITEHVTMKIEADDVEKSLQTALLAVTEAKGRVTKSELKQHAAGQLEAVLTFEVAPAQAGAVKDKLKGLGIVTHHDAQRLQQAEGGTAPTGEIKSRTDDVRFNVTLYNVANIQPREAYVLQVVVTDVPAEYKKLLDGVAAAKGQVRVSQLDEKDRTNTFAQLDFDVPATQRELFDKILAGLGDVASRNTTRAGPGESATDRKVGYRLTLKSEASVPPRETFTLNVYSLDVPGTYRKLQDAAAQLKGHVRALQLNEQDRNNISAQFDVDLVRGDMAVLDKLLDESGEEASRTTSRVQPGEIATDRKVGYRLTLRSQIPPRETLDLNIEVADVERSAAALAALVKGVKGRVTAWEGTQDAGGKSVAIQLFDVPLAAKESLAAQFKAIGKVRGQKAAQNLQAPDGKLATAHLNVRLTNVTPIVASDDGLWPQVRRSLSYAFTLLSVSLMFLIVGVSVLLPWALIVWVGVKVVRRMRNKGQATA